MSTFTTADLWLLLGVGWAIVLAFVAITLLDMFNDWRWRRQIARAVAAEEAHIAAPAEANKAAFDRLGRSATR